MTTATTLPSSQKFILLALAREANHGHDRAVPVVGTQAIQTAEYLVNRDYAVQVDSPVLVDGNTVATYRATNTGLILAAALTA
jgi:hypothetical protein